MNKANQLINKKCVPCEGIGKALTLDEAKQKLSEVAGWQLNKEATAIFRQFVMKNFLAAVRFIQKVAELAESENHHPDIHLTGYRNLKIELSTHALKGLSENDFIMAAKINELDVEVKR